MERQRLAVDRFRRIWAIVEFVARQPGSSRRLLADQFALSERQLQAVLAAHLEAFAARQFEFAGVQAQAAHNGCVDISHVMPVLDGVETQFVRHAALDAAPNARPDPLHAKWNPDLNNIYTKYTTQLRTGQTAAREAMANMANDVNAVLDEYRRQRGR